MGWLVTHLRRTVSVFVLLGLLLSTLVAPAVRTQAAPAFAAYHDVSTSYHASQAQSLPNQGYRLASLSVYDDPANPRYAAVWVLRSGPPYYTFWGKSSSDYQSLVNEWATQGFRPTMVTATGAPPNTVFA